MYGRLVGAEGEKHSQCALDLLRKWELPRSPQNYEVALNYALGVHKGIASAVQAILEDGRIPAQADIDRIFEANFQHKHLGDEVLKVGGEVSAELEDVMQRLQEAGKNTAAYERTLAGASDEMSAATDVESIRAMVDRLIFSTQKMQSHAASLEKRLSDTNDEVSRLRNNLDMVREEAMTDALTGIANRKRLDDMLNRAIAEGEQSGEPVSLAVCDIDHFKRFNDTWGHQTGDQIIRFVAACLTRCGGEANLAARYGGEEFVILMPKTGLEMASELAERARVMVESKRLVRKNTGEDLGNITISIGVAQHHTGDHPAELIEEADARLYMSKNRGRNRVTSTGKGRDNRAA